MSRRSTATAGRIGSCSISPAQGPCRIPGVHQARRAGRARGRAVRRRPPPRLAAPGPSPLEAELIGRGITPAWPARWSATTARRRSGPRSRSRLVWSREAGQDRRPRRLVGLGHQVSDRSCRPQGVRVQGRTRPAGRSQTSVRRPSRRGTPPEAGGSRRGRGRAEAGRRVLGLTDGGGSGGGRCGLDGGGRSGVAGGGGRPAQGDHATGAARRTYPAAARRSRAIGRRIAARRVGRGAIASECGPRRAGCGSGATPGREGGHKARPGAGRDASDGALCLSFIGVPQVLRCWGASCSQ